MNAGNRRSPGLILIGVALIAFGVTGMSAAFLKSRSGAVERATALTLSAALYDLGNSLRQGQSYRANLDITNHSNSELHIVRFESDCGCTLLAAEKRRLLPREVTTLKVEISTGTNRGSFGRQCAAIYRCGDETSESRCPFIIRGRIVPDFDVHPTTLTFHRNSFASQTVSFTPRDGSPLDVQVKGVSIDDLSAKVISGGVKVTFDPLKYDGAQGMAKVFVATGNPVEPQFVIDVIIR